MLGFHYGYIPQIPKPAMQKVWVDEEDVSESLWVPYPLTSDGISFKKKETFLALCELSQLFRRLLHHNKAEDVADGSHEDISIRVGIYRELLDLKARSPLICDDLTDSPAHTYTLTLVHKSFSGIAFEPSAHNCTGIITTQPLSRPSGPYKCCPKWLYPVCFVHPKTFALNMPII
jgi:hypothetical protein